ncbi:tyrosine-type recombinase/integrase [Microbacterium allomyrinae]|uniref:Tyrosine-type recombinase/integrase n=1 Tax=Microbacterium allomyrinae TaxID=2830666 RepID=A0A9X1S5D3_9MICO|nr:tyrosine-type recombinase/integrase [Microbacterium allomyrinae]MCC2034108.1 tyrosine-type recombinase/integrase [Microbacterium allomyrinae]
MLIDEYLAYLADVRRLSHNTVRLRSTYMTKLAVDFDLRTVTTVQLRTWIAQPVWSAQTVNAVTATFRSFYRWALEAGHLEHDPAMPLRSLPVPPRKPRIASRAHVDAGLASKRLEVRALTMLGAECGLRVHEIAKLHRRDRADDWLTIIGKGGQQRSVHLSPELGTVLDELEAKHPDSDWYFTSRTGRHVTTETLRAWSRRELGTNPHSLRHLAGTTVYRGTGNNLRVTQVFLGHRYPATTAIYVHVERDDLIAAGAASRLAA